MASEKRTVGAFDVRYFIATALGLIGVYLLLVAAIADPELDKTGGLHANLWTGVAMVVVAIGFAVWARLRPLYVDPQVEGVEAVPTVGAPNPALTADDDGGAGRPGPVA